MRRWFLLGLALVAAGALWAAWPTPMPAPASGPAFPRLRAVWSEIDRVELVHGTSSLQLERRGQQWAVASESGYPVRPVMAARLVDGLLGLRLLRPGPPPVDGTLIRVRALSGSVVVSALVSGTAVQRSDEAGSWVASAALPTSTDPADWTGPTLPPATGASVTVDAGLGAQAVEGLPFATARAAVLIQATPGRTAVLSFPDGSAELAVSVQDGTEWVHVTGTAAWARTLAPWAFALR